MTRCTCRQNKNKMACQNVPSTLSRVCNEGTTQSKMTWCEQLPSFTQEWDSGQQPSQSTSCQADPEDGGNKPDRCSGLTGHGVCDEGAVLNMGFCNEMRTISQHRLWRRERFGCCSNEHCCSSQRHRRRLKMSTQAAGAGVASSNPRTSKMWNSACVTG